MSIILLDGVEATGAGRVFEEVNGAKDHTIDTYFTNSGGSVTVLTVALEGSLDGTNFYELGRYSFTAADLTAKRALWHVVDRLVRFVRANIITLTETGTTAVSTAYLGR